MSEALPFKQAAEPSAKERAGVLRLVPPGERSRARARAPRPGVHQFVARESGASVDEPLFGDGVVRFVYGTLRERAPFLFRALTSARASALLGLLHFDLPLAPRLLGNRRFLERCGVDLSECVDPPESFDTARKIFERKIRYWECRPMPAEPDAIVSPADARMCVGSFRESSGLFLKGTFFDRDELFGVRGRRWARAFEGGDYAVFRLTPDKYHYNHAPVAGTVVDHFELAGAYHACNPSAVVELATPFSKNRRVVTLIQTDVPGGSRVGLVAMVEVVALMIGQIEQRYSTRRYDEVRPVEPGLFLERGAPKSLYRPGSSTDVLLFQEKRVRFEDDILSHQRRDGVSSRYSLAFGQPLAETDVLVRSLIARRVDLAGKE